MGLGLFPKSTIYFRIDISPGKQASIALRSLFGFSHLAGRHQLSYGSTSNVCKIGKVCCFGHCNIEINSQAHRPIGTRFAGKMNITEPHSTLFNGSTRGQPPMPLWQGKYLKVRQKKTLFNVQKNICQKIIVRNFGNPMFLSKSIHGVKSYFTSFQACTDR